MNLFVVNYDPVKAARQLDDKRMVKIILEVTQMLSLRASERGLWHPYGDSHRHHPVCRWVRADDRNAWWTLKYSLELCDVFREVYGHSHACLPLLRRLANDIARSGRPDSFQNSARNTSLLLDFTNHPVKEAYRHYLNARYDLQKKRPAWTNRSVPSWYDAD